MRSNTRFRIGTAHWRALVALLVVGAIAAIGGSSARATSTVSVCLTGCDATTIQGGVDAVDAGGTVDVRAGTYAGTVTIDKSVRLNGPQAGVDARTRSGAEAVVDSTITVTHGDVTVDGLSFGGTSNQLLVSSATALSGVVVQNDIFNGYGSVAVSTYDAGDVLVQHNRFAQPSSSAEAIQIRASVVQGGCNGSQVLDNAFVAATTNGGSDVNLSCTDSNSSGVTVSGNTTSGNTNGSSFVGISGVDDGISITDNTGSTEGSSIFFFGNVSGSALVDGNSFTDGGGNAVTIHGGDGLGTDDTANSGTFTITDNTLTGNARGISVATGALVAGGHVVAHGNDVSGSSVAGIQNSSTGSVDATNNWWGSAAGPGTVSAVTTDPWCTDSSCTTSSDDPSPAPASPAAPASTTTTAATTTTVAQPTQAATVVNQPESQAASPGTSGSVSVSVASTGTGAAGTPAAAPVSVALSWSPAAFTVPVTVTVTPQPQQTAAPGETATAPTPVAGGFSVGNTVVQVNVTNDAGVAVTQFAAPLQIHISSLALGEVPAYSHDGATWTTIPQLAGPSLPAGQQDGYFVNPDGSVDIYTRHATLFGLLVDTQAPGKPAVAARLVGARLYLTTHAKDNVRLVAYRLLVNGKLVKRTAHAYVVLPARVGSFQVEAVDGAGNVSKPSAAVVVERARAKGRRLQIHR